LDITIANFDFVDTFDLVIDDHCLHCICCEDDIDAYFRNIFLYLKTGGSFVLETMISPKTNFTVRPPYYLNPTEGKIAGQLLCVDDVNVGRHPLRKLFSPLALEQLLQQWGFRINFFVCREDLRFVSEKAGGFSFPLVQVIAQRLADLDRMD
ncbi:MAG: hypothetical protein HQK53_04835, partial [Oligoflexia bacterium]|nr:hypothetical protein [Oligoflexia bacterium]